MARDEIIAFGIKFFKSREFSLVEEVTMNYSQLY